MRRACVRSLIYLLTVLASSTTLAGPLAFDPSGAARPEPSPRYRQVAAQGQYGGGFIEFLMRGGQQRSAGSHPADLGPGMVESPTQPGYLVMDPRFVKQQVSYASTEEVGTIIINTNERMLYLVEGKGQALRYGIGVGRPGFTWS